MAIFIALSSFASLSMYVWHCPLSCLTTLTVALSHTYFISPAPPRGIIKSTYLSILISFATPSLEESGIRDIKDFGREFFSKTPWSTFAIALFEFSASFPPLRTQTFELLKQRAAVSLVTFGRDS